MPNTYLGKLENFRLLNMNILASHGAKMCTVNIAIVLFDSAVPGDEGFLRMI